MKGKPRILIVDDDVALSGALRDALEDEGYDATVVNEPDRAVATALSLQPDLILMDVIMPDKDGGVVAGEIRGHRALQDTPIIFLTSIVVKNEADAKGGWIGDEKFIAKPVSLPELSACIQEVLRNRA